MATSDIKRDSAVQRHITLTSAYSGGWVSDFIGLPDVSDSNARAILYAYYVGQSSYITMMKRGSDQKIAFSTGSLPNGAELYISGVIL